MNLIDFLQTGGYRFKQATLHKMQAAYFEILKAFVKHLDMPDTGNFIISGCTVAGLNITAGMLYIDGELCEFAQTPGTVASLIKKQVTHTNLAFKTGASLPVFRTTTAIIDPEGVALSAFTRIQVVKSLVWDNIGEKPEGIVLDPSFGTADPTLVERILALEARPLANVPVGLVAIWGFPADAIPLGWVAHEPLAGRFPIGKDLTDTDFDSAVGAGAIGGSKTHVNTLEEMAAHKHTFSVSASGDTGGGSVATGDGNEVSGSFNMENAGGGEAYSIMNPYRVVDFIRYTGE
jgi:hypothetical protein